LFERNWKIPFSLFFLTFSNLFPVLCINENQLLFGSVYFKIFLFDICFSFSIKTAFTTSTVRNEQMRSSGHIFLFYLKTNNSSLRTEKKTRSLKDAEKNLIYLPGWHIFDFCFIQFVHKMFVALFIAIEFLLFGDCIIYTSQSNQVHKKSLKTEENSASRWLFEWINEVIFMWFLFLNRHCLEREPGWWHLVCLLSWITNLIIFIWCIRIDQLVVCLAKQVVIRYPFELIFN